MPSDLKSLTDALLSAAEKAGADAADAIAVEGRSLDIAVRKGALEKAERAEGTDIGLRVLVGQRQACVSASDTSDATISMLAERAVAMAQEAPEDPHIGLADPEQIAQDWDATALQLADTAEEPAPSDLQAQALEAEASALAVTGVTQVQSASG
ncbi:MAG: DNA gyrase modulator, partial [Pseudomonadota bacterium]